MRATQHNGRCGKNGVFLARHNDRDFTMDEERAERAKGNMYETWDGQKNFEESEIAFYEKFLAPTLKAQNERHLARRQRSRVKTMDDYRKSPQACPEEQIICIGKMGDTVDPKVLMQIVAKQLKWEQAQFPNCRILNVALHVDEPGVPHVHVRKVWLAKGKDGYVVSQERALTEMGVEGGRGRYKNKKVTYTRLCREHFEQLCRDHGIQLEGERLQASKVGLDILDYKRQELKQEIKMLQAENARIRNMYWKNFQGCFADYKELQKFVNEKMDEMVVSANVVNKSGKRKQDERERD